MKALIRFKNPTTFSFFFFNFSSFKSTTLIASLRAPARYLTFSPLDLTERRIENTSASCFKSGVSANNLERSTPDLNVKLNL